MGGSRKGIPNRTTSQAREVFRLLLERQAPKAERWLDEIAETDKKAALDLLLKISERFIPKLQSHTFEPNEGKQVSINISIKPEEDDK